MFNFKAWLVSLLIFLELSQARLATTSIRVGSGFTEYRTCFTAVKKYKYNYKNLGIGKYASSYDAVCGYPPAIGSLLFCTSNLMGNDTATKEKIFNLIEKKCHYYSSYSYPVSFYKEQYDNATDYYIPISKLNTSKYVYNPTYPKASSLSSSLLTQYNMDYNIDTGTWFSVAFYGYYLVLIIMSAIYNVLRLSGISKKINSAKILKLFQKYIIFPTIFPNGKYSEPYGYKFLTILYPNRIQFLSDFFIFLMHIAFYCVSYKSRAKWTVLVGYRSGIMAFGKIPLLILLAGRNNFLLWITGWSYNTFLHHHKIMACWMFVDAVIHSVAFTIDLRHKWTYELTMSYFTCGISATIFSGVLILQSLHFFRSVFYEYFLTMHVVFVICYIIMCWYHCISLGWMEWLVASCCVWIFDRLIRVIRLAAFGYKKATITVVGNKLFKVEVPKPSFWLHTSGTFGYIYFAGFIFWENHPFTVVLEDGNLCAYIRVKRGITARIWKQLLENNNKMVMRISIEGPYGGNLSSMVKMYDDAIFVAGGSGVPGILEGAAKSTSGKLIWISQTLEFVTAYHKLIERINIPIDIYITREKATDRQCSKRDFLSNSESDTQSSECSEKYSSDNELESLSTQISIHYIRPSLEEIINHEVAEASFDNVAINACGPPVMMDNLRNLISENVTKWDKSIDFFDEFQTW